LLTANDAAGGGRATLDARRREGEDTMKPQLKIALIGAGFIGRAHAIGLGAVNVVFADAPAVALRHALCDADPARAEAAGRSLGFARWTTDWREAIDAADAVIIAVPSISHAEIARVAIAAGKPVLCEKPVGLSSTQAQELADAAAAACVPSATGFTYLRAPMVRYARELLASGQLGRPVHFYGRHFEDYLADPRAPFSWRLDASIAGRCGALGDLGCHIVSVARYLLGPIAALSGNVATVHAQRPVGGPDGPLRAVENEDYAAAHLRFADGVPGMIEVSRIATGRKMDISFEVTCERGAIRFDGERTNELQVHVGPPGGATDGFRRVLISPAHPAYAGFLPAPGHGLGFIDLKTIEIREFIGAASGQPNSSIDLAEAARIGRVCEAVIDSAARSTWIADPETPA
jgi:predicted dehydrogenase